MTKDKSKIKLFFKNIFFILFFLLSIIFLFKLNFLFKYINSVDFNFNFFCDKNEESTEVFNEFECKEIFAFINKGFFVCDDNKINNISYCDNNGNIKWQSKINFNYFYSSHENKYLALANYNNICVFDIHGKIFEKKIFNKNIKDKKIIFIKVNKSGNCCIVVNKNNDYEIICLDKLSKIIANYKFSKNNFKKNIFITSCDLSLDNKILVLSTIEESVGKITNKILFFSLDDNKNKILKSFEIDDKIFNIKFLDNKNIIYFTFKSIHVFKINKNTIKKISSIKLRDDIYKLCFTKKRIILVLNKDKNIIFCYRSKDLKFIDKIFFESNIESFISSNCHDNFYINLDYKNGSKFLFLNKKFKKKFEYLSDESISFFLNLKNNKLMINKFGLTRIISPKYNKFLNK